MESNCSKYSGEFTVCICSLECVREVAVRLDELLEKEGCKRSGLAPSVCVVAVDGLMAICWKGSNNRPKSVDIAFGCEKKVLQLVECRYNYVNPLNLERKELELKVSNSKELLQRQVQSCLDYTHCNTTVLLFSDKLIEQARNRVRRLFPMRSSKKSESFKALSTNEFIAVFF